jgi:glutathione S-transferase
MSSSRRVVFYHAPQSRSAGALVLLEELGADYELRPLDLQKKESRSSGYLGVNPMGKVPAIVHDGALVTEQGAVYTYLADLYPEAGLSPRRSTPTSSLRERNSRSAAAARPDGSRLCVVL